MKAGYLLTQLNYSNFTKMQLKKLRRVKIGESLTIHENKHEDFRISVYEMPVEYEKPCQNK